MEQAKKYTTEINTPKYFFYCGVGGLLACGLTHAAFTPVDVVKCNTQANPKEFTGTFQGFRYIYSGRAESFGFPGGFRGLAKGWGPTLAGYSAQGLFKYGLYDYFKYKYSEIVGKETAHKYRDIVYMSASASAEFIADIALCPFEAVKVRIQTTPTFARGMLDGMPKMVATEGFANLYAGLVPLWGRQIPYTVIKFVAFEDFSERIYNYLEKSMNKPKHSMSLFEQMGVVFAAGYAAGILCGAVSHPADTMVSKINKLKMDGSLMTKMRVIYYGTPESPGIGFAGLWKGLGPRVFMIGTLTGLQWLIYGGFKAAMGLPTPGGAEKK